MHSFGVESPPRPILVRCKENMVEITVSIEEAPVKSIRRRLVKLNIARDLTRVSLPLDLVSLIEAANFYRLTELGITRK